MLGNIFSEIWHRVSDLKLSLIFDATIEKQVYRGKTWYVILEPYNNRFFRVTPKAYRFLMQLTPKKTLNEIWQQYLEHNPKETPTQDEVIRLLTQLHQTNLLYFKNIPNNEDIFNRYVTKQNVNIRNKFISFLYIKIPIWDPHKWLEKSQWLTHLLINRVTLVIWLLTLLFGIKTFLDNYSSFSMQSEGLLAPSNIFLLYISLFVLKFFHEMGHAMMSRKFGGDVHTMGLMFIVFTPLPYMDASSSWLFKNKWHRIMVSSAGMFVELFFASIATVIWAHTGDGVLHSIAFNIMIIGSVSSVVFNGNPLLKFDAYYILSDYLEIPNLQKKSTDIWLYWWQKYIFEVSHIKKAYETHKEAILLAVYGFLSFFYRFLVAISIAFFVSDQMFELGVAVILLSLYVWILKPLWTYIHYLFSDERLLGKRKKAFTLTLSIMAVLVLFFGFTPCSYSIYADGVVSSREYVNVFSKTDGYLHKIYFKDGERVKKGDLLLSFKNSELSIEIKSVEAKIKESELLILKSRNESIADVKAINNQLEVLHEQLEFLKLKEENLHVYATKDGIWVSNSLVNYINTYLKLGDKLGEILPHNNFDFVGVVSQEDASDLFGTILESDVKLYSRSCETLRIKNVSIIPYETYELPSPSLGFMGGGEILTDTQDKNGIKTQEAYFKVIATFEDQNRSFLYNERGILRIKVPDKTLFDSGVEAVKKLLQKRYKI